MTEKQKTDIQSRIEQLRRQNNILLRALRYNVINWYIEKDNILLELLFLRQYQEDLIERLSESKKCPQKGYCTLSCCKENCYSTWQNFLQRK